MEAAELIAEGIALAKQGDHEEARRRFEQAVQFTPSSADAWEHLGNALMALRRSEEALVAFDRALALDSARTAVLAQRAWALMVLGRNAEGLSDCEKALRQSPDDAEVWDVRSLLLLGLQRYEEAVRSSDEAVARNPEATRFWANRMTIFRVWNRPEQALEACERALTLDSMNSEFWIVKGNLLNQLQRYQEAEAAFDEGLTRETTDARGFFQRGVARHASGKPEPALKDFQSAAELGLANVGVWVFTAQVLQQLDRTEEALRYYDMALAEDNSSWLAWMQRGVAAASVAHFDEAVANTTRATELVPNNGDVWFHHATVLEAAGRFSDAAAAFDRALTLDPQHQAARARRQQVPFQCADQITQIDRWLASHPHDFDSWWSRGDIFCDIGRFDLALPCLARALTLAPEVESLWNQRGWCLNMIGDYQAAIAVLRRGSELGGKNPNIWGNMSHAYNQLGDFENSRTCAERALQGDPNHPQSLSNLGMALLNLNCPAEALDYFDRVLAIQPSALRWSNKALALMRLDRGTEALSCVDQALALTPHDPDLQQMKASIVAQFG